MANQLLKDGTISIDYVKSKENLADPLTKPLGREIESNRNIENVEGQNKSIGKGY